MTAPPAPGPSAEGARDRDDTAVEVGRLIARARQAQGLSQAELARRTGLRRELVGRIERGQANPTLVVLIALAGGLGYAMEELLARECLP